MTDGWRDDTKQKMGIRRKEGGKKKEGGVWREGVSHHDALL